MRWEGVSLGLSCAVAVAAAVLPASAVAEIIEVGPNDDVEAAINALQPGDELVLQGGTYTLSERFSFDIAGTESEPIVIRAKDGEQPHLNRPNADQNIIDIDGAEHVIIRGIEFSGGSAGVRISGARFLTIEDCEIHDTGDVALRANDGGVTYESLRILRNHIHHTNNTGEGMYLGCNDNGCRLQDSLIEGNYIHHTNQPSVDQGDGIELKEGSFGNTIRDNVIHDTNYPCILAYSTVGNGPANVIERNVMWGCGDHAIQCAADATIRNNIILGSNSDGIAMQPHQAGSPSNLVVVHNTVLHPTNAAISLRGTTGTVVIANNAVYAQSGNAIFASGGDTSGVTVAGNVGVGGVSGLPGGGFAQGDIATDFVDGHYGGAPPIDVFPAVGGALIEAGDPAHGVEDDFNGTPREGTLDVGAYRFDPDGNPGWPIGEGFKELPDPDGDDGGTGTEGDDGGSDGSGGGSGDDGGTADDGSGDGGEGSSDGKDGCGCRSRGAPASGLGLLVVALARFRRSR
jgi:hypothetical protein